MRNSFLRQDRPRHLVEPKASVRTPQWVARAALVLPVVATVVILALAAVLA